MDDSEMLLLAACAGVLFFLIAYPVAKAYISFMKKEKMKHPNLAYVLASMGASNYWSSVSDDELEAKVSPRLKIAMMVIGGICLFSLLINGYWKAWLYVAIMIVAILVVVAMVVRNQPKNDPVNKPRKQSDKS